MGPGKPGPRRGDPRNAETGRMGGNACKAAYGKDYFKAIGAKGGAKTKERYGSEHFAKMSRERSRSGAERQQQTPDNE